jgi:AraC-like DNA-binding protein
MLALQVRVDIETVRELVSKMVDTGLPAPPSASARAMAVMPLDADLLGLIDRLMGALGSRMEAAVLGPQLLRELHYRVLTSPAGGCLRELAQWQGRVGGVHRSIERMRSQLERDWPVAELAKEAALSPSAFHAAFKQVTGQSPMQYLKAVRLHRARQILGQSQRLASDIAFEVGYQSASQFSRDYKRQFGVTPSEGRQLSAVSDATPRH